MPTDEKKIRGIGKYISMKKIEFDYVTDRNRKPLYKSFISAEGLHEDAFCPDCGSSLKVLVKFEDDHQIEKYVVNCGFEKMNGKCTYGYDVLLGREIKNIIFS
jgi:hypothetical protein